jgi:hypothetical protein
MSNPNNLSSVTESTIDKTTTFFNNFFGPSFAISQNIDDSVIGFFEKITQNKESAKILASAVIYTCLSRNIDVMETLAKFSTMTEGELNSYVTMFLKLNRAGTSYLGINNYPRISKYVQRMLIP